MDKHDLVASIKKIALEMGKNPKRAEFIAMSEVKNPSKQLDIHFQGSFVALLQAAGLDLKSRTEKKFTEEKLLKKYKALCSKKEQIQGFFRHTIDLAELFARAGEPEVLKLVVWPDVHTKHKDDKAVSCALKFMRIYDPHGNLILGDFADCDGLPHWPAKDLEPRRIVPEMKLCRSLFEEIQAASPNAVFRVFCEGNHENWIEQALTEMPELFDGLAELGIEISAKKLLGLDKYGYDFFPMNHLVQIGKAHFTHGIYTGNNHAAKHMGEFKTNIYYGHLHDMMECNNTNIDGPIEAASLGCLCKLDAAFLRGKKNNWVHGFGTFEFRRDGSYSFLKHRIINGTMSYNGVLIEG
jgi:hypothetical protein